MEMEVTKTYVKFLERKLIKGLKRFIILKKKKVQSF